jgi:hypothetical protein
LDEGDFFDGEGARGVGVEGAGEGFEVRHDVFPGIGGDLLGGGGVGCDDELYKDICDESARVRVGREKRDLPRLSPKRRSPSAASASLPVARRVICNAPLIFTNFAGEPSGRRSLSLTF